MQKIMKSKKHQAAASSNERKRTGFVSIIIPTIHPRNCALCGGPQYVIGVYEPGDPRIRLHENGKVRRFIYALCDSCFGKPDAPERVEKVIHAELARLSIDTTIKENQLH